MNIFITGNPRCGKSTLIKKLIENLPKKIAGIITPEIRVNNNREGFKIIDLVSKEEKILASVNIQQGPNVSKYKVNIEGIDYIVDKFLESFDNAAFIIIDEIGMMEFYSKKFKETIDKVLNSNKIVIATLSKKLVKRYKDKGQVIYLTRENFDETFNRILELVD